MKKTLIAALAASLVLIVPGARAQSTNQITYTHICYTPVLMEAPLTLWNDGNFYGISAFGTTNIAGAVFRLTPTGDYTLLHAMNGAVDGWLSVGGFTAFNGYLYGTTETGGTGGDGTLFRTDTNGNLTVLVSFNGANGAGPVSPPISSLDGTKLFGSTTGGGSNNYGSFYCRGTNNVSVWFRGLVGTNGGTPYGPPTYGNDGFLYTTVQIGGKYLYWGGIGRLDPTNGAWTLVFSFTNGMDGGHPETPLILGKDDAFYGTTSDATLNEGTIFRFDYHSTNLTTLHQFNGTDGGAPQALITGPDGAFYGMTAHGGSNGSPTNGGTAFRMDIKGNFTTLTNFPNSLNHPNQPVFGTDNRLYSTTANTNFFQVGVPMATGTLNPFGLTNQTLLTAYVVGGGYQYQFQSTTNLGDPSMWTDVGSPVTATDVFVTATDPAVNTNAFYRLKQNNDPLSYSIVTNSTMILPINQLANGNWTGFPAQGSGMTNSGNTNININP